MINLISIKFALEKKKKFNSFHSFDDISLPLDRSWKINQKVFEALEILHRKGGNNFSPKSYR